MSIVSSPTFAWRSLTFSSRSSLGTRVAGLGTGVRASSLPLHSDRLTLLRKNDRAKLHRLALRSLSLAPPQPIPW